MPTFRDVARHLGLGIGATVAIAFFNNLAFIAQASTSARANAAAGNYAAAYDIRMTIENNDWWLNANDIIGMAFLLVFPMVAAWAMTTRNAEDKFVRIVSGAVLCGVFMGAMENPKVLSVRAGTVLIAGAALISIRATPVARWLLIPLSACTLLLAVGTKLPIEFTKEVPVISGIAIYAYRMAVNWVIIISAILVNRWSPFGSEKSLKGPSQAVEIPT